MQKDSADNLPRPVARGFAQSGVRLANERAVMTLIGTNPGLSNAELARQSGLGAQTTSRIVADLEDRGLVKRGDVLRGRRGQPATPLYIDPEGGYVFGIELGWRHAEVLLRGIGGQNLATHRISYDWPDARTIIGQLTEIISSMRAQMTPRQSERLVGIGIASPTFIYLNINRLGAPPEQTDLWKELKLTRALTEATGLEAHWVNDGSAACWAELIAHPQPRPQGFAYFQVGTYIAAGILMEGKLWEGATGNAANLGTILISDEHGKPTYAHLVATLKALDGRLQQGGRRLPEGNPIDWDWPSLEPEVGQWLEAAGSALAQAILSTQAVTEIDNVIIDSVMPRPILERLVERVRHHVAALPDILVAKASVSLGRLGAPASAMGAGQLMLHRRFFLRAWDLFAT